MVNFDPLVPGLEITASRLDQLIERNTALLQRGLALNDQFVKAAETQERAREGAEAAARARGENLAQIATDEEKAWGAFQDRALSGIALQSRSILEQIGLDPRRSALFEEYPELIAHACDPQMPVFYDPTKRHFALIETWGPAVRSIHFCPWSGKELPSDLSSTWFDLIDKQLGTEDWTTEEARRRLGEEFFTEAWWVKRGL